MGVGTILSPSNAELTMNATNENKCVSWSSRGGFATRQRRILVAITLSGLAFLGIWLATGQAVPLGAKAEVLVSVSARPQSTLTTDPNHQEILLTDSQLQASIPTASPEGDFEVIRDFALDGLEFALAAAEVSNQFGPYRQIGDTISWISQELSQSEGGGLAVSKQPNDASLAAYPLPSPTEKEMVTWLLQNSPWTR